MSREWLILPYHPPQEDLIRSLDARLDAVRSQAEDTTSTGTSAGCLFSHTSAHTSPTGSIFTALPKRVHLQVMVNATAAAISMPSDSNSCAREKLPCLGQKEAAIYLTLRWGS